MKLKFSMVSIVIACLLSWATVAQAQEWRFSGFGSLGVVHSTEKNGDFTVSLPQPKGAGYSDNWTANPDSKLGGQIDAKFSPQWSASAQAVTQYGAHGSYKPTLSVGFLKFSPGAGVELRAGRLPYAAFLLSDYRAIGYSQPWVRSPIEVYAVSFPHVDGLDLTWRTAFAEVGLKAQLLAGQQRQDQTVSVLKSKDIAGFNLTADRGDLSLRLSYIRVGSLTVEGPDIATAFGIVRSGLPPGALYPGAPPLPPNPAAADQYEIKNLPAAYTSLGATYDPGNWFVTAEVGRITGVGFFVGGNEFYVTAGLRYKAFTPYVNLAQFKHYNEPTSDSPIVQSLIQQLATRDQRTVSLGLRWDFAKSADLKLQYDRVSHPEGAHGFLTNIQPGFVPGGHYGVFTAAVDFVF